MRKITNPLTIDELVKIYLEDARIAMILAIQRLEDEKVKKMKIILLLLPLFMGADLPIKYPEKTLTMSKVEFYQWAVDQNKQAQEAWTKEFNKGYQYIHGSKIIETIKKSGYNSGSTITPLSISKNPGRFSSTIKRQKRKVSYRYKNPDFKHPGPLTIINPYVKPKK